MESCKKEEKKNHINVKSADVNDVNDDNNDDNVYNDVYRMTLWLNIPHVVPLPKKQTAGFFSRNVPVSSTEWYPLFIPACFFLRMVSAFFRFFSIKNDGDML